MNKNITELLHKKLNTNNARGVMCFYTKGKVRPLGFTLVEVLVGTAVFILIALAAYQAFINLSKLVSLNQ